MTPQPDARRITAAPDGPVLIQPAIWPEHDVSTLVLPYVTLTGGAMLSLSHGGVDFLTGGMLRTDTYFNLFNLGKWTRACGETSIGLQLRGQGRFQLTVFKATQNQFLTQQRMLLDRELKVKQRQKAKLPQARLDDGLVSRGDFAERIFSETVTLDGVFDLPLQPEARDPRTILFFALTALDEGRLDDFAWTTTAAPRQLPELVLSVTTFRREAAVSATITRFRAFRATAPMRDHIRMLIVDNGQSVDAASGDGVTVIPNANLGGAGGFTRGLLETQKTGGSHCLFMDDDASIHMGAITRTWMILAYSQDPRLAVVGAMMDADHRWKIWENGATFDRGCHPLYFGADMRDPDVVFGMEFDTTIGKPKGFYGGWWYFAFPVTQLEYLPFPFFVRGDDVSFSLANDFTFVTLPGVASIQESFVSKASPTTWYLDLRSHLAHHLSLPAKDVGWLGLRRMLLGFYLRTVLRFHYDSLSAVNLAIEDILRGPQFFADHADMAQRRGDLKAMTTTEVWEPLDRTKPERIGRLPRPLRALLLLTLNGHLLPFANLRGSKLVMPPESREDFRLMYGARQITFLNADRSAAYTLRRDRKRFATETWRFIKNVYRLARDYRQIRDTWQAGYPELTSRAFWDDKLKPGE
ncbi:hypothetical protein AN189_16765 [Loktanella sp. 3ANDIMAR09]|uniref:glycosyltransferase n=1 Tax=Loktanella sp. 3ANDIMAR09 TaxID=1225657 RepID=UPI0006FA7AEE|nr:glycosyltransferase [Loktanella sp. 3ANDIMAR09]KQI67140.1 hypothetical protein AN189_16765 [Loktanella sp. 3ANDIMAR09]